MILVKKVPKAWTQNSCYGCGKQATAQIDFNTEFFNECIDLCTRCFRSIVNKREKIYGPRKAKCGSKMNK